MAMSYRMVDGDRAILYQNKEIVRKGRYCLCYFTFSPHGKIYLSFLIYERDYIPNILPFWWHF